jgi:hypothetical protein
VSKIDVEEFVEVFGKFLDGLKEKYSLANDEVKPPSNDEVKPPSSDEVKPPSRVTLKLVLPGATMGGLHFNKQEVHAVFEMQDDGWWQSKDILFMSARNIVDDNCQDLLTSYLNSYDFANSIRQQLPEEIFGEVMTPDKIEVSLPRENQGAKKYHGVDCWYWLANVYSSSAARFCAVSANGGASHSYASTVGGCSPAFRVTGTM